MRSKRLIGLTLMLLLITGVVSAKEIMQGDLDDVIDQLDRHEKEEQLKLQTVA